MKISLFTILLMFFLCSQLHGKQVELLRAQNVAASFLNSLNDPLLKSVSISELTSVNLSLQGEARFNRLKSSTTKEMQLVYLFKKAEGGFVLVSGDDLAKPILGYSIDSPIDEENMPVNFLKWIEEYKNQIASLQQQATLKSTSAKTEWDQLEAGTKLSKASPSAVNPLMTTKWDQLPLYNNLCPQKNSYSKKSVTGCVATAMAQVIKYHNYPVNGTGIHSYYHSSNTVTYGTLSANFGATTYDWSQMPNQLTSNSTAAQIKAVATLMLHCGIGVDMNYSPSSSGAQILEEKAYGTSSSEYALKEFFNFDKTTVKGVLREGKTAAQWISLLKSEIDARRPILFGGVGSAGGHAFVADGYDNNNYFHFNWGWSGNSDGYYSVDALNPVDLGTGAGNGSYNNIQQVVIGIKPPTQNTGSTTISDDIRLYSTVTLPTIYQLNSFDFDVKIVNYGSNNFTGKFGAALFNSKGNFVTFIDSLSSNTTLNSGYFNTYNFSNEGLSVYPGNFMVGIYFRSSNNNWVAVSNGKYKNFVNTEIISPFADTKIQLYDSIRVSPNPIITGGAVSVTTNIANFGNNTYVGEFGAGLFTLDGDIVQSIEVIDANNLPGMKYNEFTFNTSEITAEPGSYYIGLVHFPNKGDDQVVIAPNSYLNPIEVNVTIPALVPDRFENNNQVSDATEINLKFEDNLHWYYYTDINLDTQTDEDYFKLDLPSGYKYKVWARVHDAYSSEIEDEKYTCDVIFAHSDQGEWVDVMDTEMPYNYIMSNGGEVYFGVISYYEGETGTYAIEFKIERMLGSDVNDLTSLPDERIYPNPASQQLHIESTKAIHQVELIDNTGRTVLKQIQNELNHIELNLSNIIPGMYHVKIYYPEDIHTQKLIIDE